MNTYSYSFLESSKKTRSVIKQYDTFAKEVKTLFTTSNSKSEKEYNLLLKRLHKTSLALLFPSIPKTDFQKELNQIKIKTPLAEQTAWGGVSLKKVDTKKDFIQKLLVVKKDGVLGFEIHTFKNEKLLILQGFCLVFHVDKEKSPNVIQVKLAGPQDTFMFAPRDAHGILSLTNCIIQETSTNHLDDLIYIFHASLS